MEMTLLEMICAIERLQALYNTINDGEQHEAKQYVRWAIKHLADKIYFEVI